MEMGQRTIRVELHREPSPQEGVDSLPAGRLLLWLFERLAELPDIGPGRRPAEDLPGRSRSLHVGLQGRFGRRRAGLDRRSPLSLQNRARDAAQHNAAQAEYDRLAALV